MRKSLAIAFLVIDSVLSLYAQSTTSAPVPLMANAVAVCPEGSSVTAIPPGTVYQFGAGSGSTYTPPATVTATSPSVPFSTSYDPTNPLYPFDPDQYVVKTLFVQQRATAYTVSCLLAGNSAPTVFSIPALAPPAPPINIIVPVAAGLPMGQCFSGFTGVYFYIICNTNPLPVPGTSAASSPQ